MRNDVVRESQVVEELSEEVQAYRGGKNRLMGLFVGKVMKRTQGRGDPKRVAEILTELIAGGA